MPTLLGLIKQEGPGQDLVCFCVAACLASLVLDEAAMEAVVQRKDSPVMFENALALLEKTIDSLDTHAVEVGWTAALVLRCSQGLHGLRKIWPCRSTLAETLLAWAAQLLAWLLTLSTCICQNAVTKKRPADQDKLTLLQAASRVRQRVLSGSMFCKELFLGGACQHRQYWALHSVLLPDVPASH